MVPVLQPGKLRINTFRALTQPSLLEPVCPPLAQTPLFPLRASAQTGRGGPLPPANPFFLLALGYFLGAQLGPEGPAPRGCWSR